MIFKPASFRLWNFWAPYYEKLWVQSVSLTPTRRAVIQQVSAWIQSYQPLHAHQAHETHTAQPSSPTFPKLRILDVGCGTGQLLRDIRRAFPHLPLELTGVDYAPAMIAQAQALESGETRPITYACLTAQQLDQLPQPCHLILCTHSFPYYPDQRKALDQFRQALVPGGHVIMAQAAGVTLYDRFVLFFVKWTTGAALYPSEPAVRQLIHRRFQVKLVRPLRGKWFMPTILLFHLEEAAQ